MKKISIIIPVYNVEKYIEKCINSALRQDLPFSEYEILVIDDESPDNSVEIVNKMASQYENIRLISQKNKGLGGARNTGILEANGKYLLFLDADDYILENRLKSLYETANSKNLDILEFEAKGIMEGTGAEVYHMQNNNDETIYTGETYIQNVVFHSSACNKLYRTEFLQKNSLQFMEHVYIEDIQFNTRAIFYARKIAACNLMVSHFIQNPTSITRSPDLHKRVKMVNDIKKVTFSIQDFMNDNIKKDSVAYLPVNRRIGSLTVALLIKSLRLKGYFQLKKDILSELKERGLYPVRTKDYNFKKNLFRKLLNIPIFYSLISHLK